MAPFYGWGSTASRLEPLRGTSLLFTTKFPDINGTHFIWIGNLAPEPLGHSSINYFVSVIFQLLKILSVNNV